ADPGAHPTNLRRRGYNHLAFRVDDIASATEHLVANGVNLLSEEMDYISRKLRLFQGPEGITLELVEWVDDATEDRRSSTEQQPACRDEAPPHVRVVDALGHLAEARHRMAAPFDVRVVGAERIALAQAVTLHEHVDRLRPLRRDAHVAPQVLAGE